MLKTRNSHCACRGLVVALSQIRTLSVTTVFMCEWWVSVIDHQGVEVVQLPFLASFRSEPFPDSDL